MKKKWWTRVQNITHIKEMYLSKIKNRKWKALAQIKPIMDQFAVLSFPYILKLDPGEAIASGTKPLLACMDANIYEYRKPLKNKIKT